jgi:hypothetical protein
MTICVTETTVVFGVRQRLFFAPGLLQMWAKLITGGLPPAQLLPLLSSKALQKLHGWRHEELAIPKTPRKSRINLKG